MSDYLFISFNLKGVFFLLEEKVFMWRSINRTICKTIILIRRNHLLIEIVFDWEVVSIGVETLSIIVPILGIGDSFGHDKGVHN